MSLPFYSVSCNFSVVFLGVCVCVSVCSYTISTTTLLYKFKAQRGLLWPLSTHQIRVELVDIHELTFGARCGSRVELTESWKKVASLTALGSRWTMEQLIAVLTDRYVKRYQGSGQFNLRSIVGSLSWAEKGWDGSKSFFEVDITCEIAFVFSTNLLYRTLKFYYQTFFNIATLI